MTAYGTGHNHTSTPSSLSPSLQEREESRKRAAESKAKRKAIIEKANQRERESYLRLIQKRKNRQLQEDQKML